MGAKLIEVDLIQVGRMPQALELKEGSTVQDALNLANIRVDNRQTLTVDDQPVNPQKYELEDGQVIMITEKIEGNHTK